MKRLTILLFAICCLSCKQSHSQRKVDPAILNVEAIKLYNQATKLYFSQFDEDKRTDESKRVQALEKGINLLDQAIAIDSNYYAPYRNKMTFQAELNQQDSAFLTAKLIFKKWPTDITTKITLGKYYELNDDTISAYEYYKNALSDINHILDSTNTESNVYKYEQIEKAEVLILLNQPEKARGILKESIDKERNDLIKRHLNRLMGISRRELLFEKPAPSFI
jgi:hypothetical protein